MADSQKYGRLTLIDGGQKRRNPRLRTAAEIRLDDRMRDRYLRCVTPDGKVPSRAVQEIREGKQAPWRTTARRVLEMVEEGVPVPVIKAAAVYEMERFVDELVAGEPNRAA